MILYCAVVEPQTHTRCSEKIEILPPEVAFVFVPWLTHAQNVFTILREKTIKRFSGPQNRVPLLALCLAK